MGGTGALSMTCADGGGERERERDAKLDEQNRGRRHSKAEREDGVEKEEGERCRERRKSTTQRLKARQSSLIGIFIFLHFN